MDVPKEAGGIRLDLGQLEADTCVHPVGEQTRGEGALHAPQAEPRIAVGQDGHRVRESYARRTVLAPCRLMYMGCSTCRRDVIALEAYESDVVADDLGLGVDVEGVVAERAGEPAGGSRVCGAVANLIGGGEKGEGGGEGRRIGEGRVRACAGRICYRREASCWSRVATRRSWIRGEISTLTREKHKISCLCCISEGKTRTGQTYCPGRICDLGEVLPFLQRSREGRHS